MTAVFFHSVFPSVTFHHITFSSNSSLSVFIFFTFLCIFVHDEFLVGQKCSDTHASVITLVCTAID